MNLIHASLSASISELKRNPTALIKHADGKSVVILNHNKPAAYLIPAEMYERLLNRVENAELLEIAKKRQQDKDQAIQVDIDDL